MVTFFYFVRLSSEGKTKTLTYVKKLSRYGYLFQVLTINNWKIMIVRVGIYTHKILDLKVKHFYNCSPSYFREQQNLNNTN